MVELVEFFQDYVRQFFVDHTYIPDGSVASLSIPREMLKMLYRHTRTGNHTDVMVWSPLYLDHYKYNHHLRKPFGQASPFQCEKCLVIRPWKVDDTDLEALHEKYKGTSGIAKQLQKHQRTALLQHEKNRLVLKCKTSGCPGSFEARADGEFNWFEAFGSKEDGFWQGVRHKL